MQQSPLSTNANVQTYLKRIHHRTERGILVIDDHELVRLGLRALVKSSAEASNARVQVFEADTLVSGLAMYAANRRQIDCVLLDLGLPDGAGLSGLKCFRRLHPEARVAILSGNTDRATINAALSTGAVAYVQKTGRLEEVMEYISSEGLLASPAPTEQLIAHDSESGEIEGLSIRQNAILKMLLQGKSNREISEKVCLAEGTVKNHVSAILLHFGANTRAQLISLLRA